MIDPVALLKGIGGGSAAALVPIVAMYNWATPIDMGKAAAIEPGPYKDTLCRALEEAIGRLCVATPDDSICVDREMFREQAGC